MGSIILQLSQKTEFFKWNDERIDVNDKHCLQIFLFGSPSNESPKADRINEASITFSEEHE